VPKNKNHNPLKINAIVKMMALMKGHFGTKFGTYVTIDPEVMRQKLKKAGRKACLFPEHTISLITLSYAGLE
jgi:hypothetical protein